MRALSAPTSQRNHISYRQLPSSHSRAARAPPRGWAGLNHPPCSSPPPLLHLDPSHGHAACPGPALPQRAGLWFTDGPSLPVPAEHHPSLSLEVPQAEKSIYPPGTWAQSLPTTTGSLWLPPACTGASGLAQGLEGLAGPPLQTSEPEYVLICPQREAGPHQKLQVNPRPWKVLAKGSNSLCVLAAQLAHSPGSHLILIHVWSHESSLPRWCKLSLLRAGTRGDRIEHDSPLR